jgi:hypothetical protein
MAQLGHNEAEPRLTVMNALDYIHAPMVAACFMSYLIVSVCILQKPVALPLQRRRIAKVFVLALLTGYVAEVLYYFGRYVSEKGFQTPQHAAFHCLGSILVWFPLSSSIVSSKPLRWQPYFGAFVLQSILEITICVLRGLSLPTQDVYSSVPLSFSCLRAFASLGLLVNGFFILISRQTEKSTDEEGQSLLGKPANGTAGYGTTESSSSSTTAAEGAQEVDRNQAAKDAQAKRLEEEGGWLGYLKGFLIFLPYLWPKDDWRVMGCLAVRGLDLISGRFFNLLGPRQLGIITDKLNSGQGGMPWKDIALWGFYHWANSYSGFGWLDSFASMYIQKSAFRRITMLAYSHVMNLSMDFQTGKDSGEV